MKPKLTVFQIAESMKFILMENVSAGMATIEPMPMVIALEIVLLIK